MLEKMLFRTYETLANRNQSEGFHVIFVYVNDITGGLFINLLLFALFLVILFASYFAQIRTRNNGDFAVSFAVAGFVVFGASLLLSLIPNLMNIFNVVIALAIAIIGALWLILSKTSNE